jgi:hypothetical protein
MQLTRRQWQATYLVAAFFGCVAGSVIKDPAPEHLSNHGRDWIVQLYAVEREHITVIAMVVLFALSLFALKKKLSGITGWPLYFSIGLCLGKMFYSK